MYIYVLFAGVSRGQLQKLQGEVAKMAGLAALMCKSAGWWQLETLLTSLSQQAAVGARPELLSLMEVRLPVQFTLGGLPDSNAFSSSRQLSLWSLTANGRLQVFYRPSMLHFSPFSKHSTEAVVWFVAHLLSTRVNNFAL